MTEVLHLSSRWNMFLVTLLISIQSIVFSLVVEFHLKFFEMFSISPQQAYSVCYCFSNNSVITFLEGCFPSSFVAEVGIFFSILLFQWSIFYSFFRRQFVVDFIKYHPIFSSSCSIPSMFNQSAARILPLSSCFNRSGFEFYLVH